MATKPTPFPVPSPAEVAEIAALRDPVVRNLRITECYARLSAAFAVRTGPGANWCTFATWASRQAGCTIRAEDLHEGFRKHTLTGFLFAHPIRSAWRWLLRRGLLNPNAPLGRVVHEINSPFDAFERASDAVARGNRKVFEEIGFEFARYLTTCPAGGIEDDPAFREFLAGLRPGPPPDGQDYLKRAFARYQEQQHAEDPRIRAQRIFAANLEIGFHEQTRLQPEIRESLESAPRTSEDLGMRLLQAIYPGARDWKAFIRRPLAVMLSPIARALAKWKRDLACRIVTDALMTLALPGTTLMLGRHLDRAPAQPLSVVDDPSARELLARFEPAVGACDDCGVLDWSDLPQRMHFIQHLFRAFHDDRRMLESPFTPDQVAAMRAGRIPNGTL